MTKRFITFFVIVISLVWAGSVFAQDADVQDTSLPFAAVIDSQLWVYLPGQAPVQIATTVPGVQYPAWNAAGDLLAYVAADENYVPHPYVYNTATGTSTQVGEFLESGFPLSFTSDNRLLFAKINPTSDFMQGIYKVDIWAAAPDGSSEPTLLGTFDQGVGCGGGSLIPADLVYSAETEGLGGFGLILAETPFGILHSAECGGSTTGLLDPATGTDKLISQNLGRVKLSPDKSKIAGIELTYTTEGDVVTQTTRLLVVDLATLATSEIVTEDIPFQLAWSADSASLFYTTQYYKGALLTPDEQSALTVKMGFDIGELTEYTATIVRANVADGSLTEVYSADVYHIGRLTATPDGSALIVTTIPNLQAWVQGILDGSVPFDGMMEDQLKTVAPSVVRVNLADGNVTPIGTNLGRFTLNTGLMGQ